jgi:hypothetical protein
VTRFDGFSTLGRFLSEGAEKIPYNVAKNMQSNNFFRQILQKLGWATFRATFSCLWASFSQKNPVTLFASPPKKGV